MIEAIMKYSFENSPYPVVLSIENHCSLDQQRIMAKIMVTLTYGMTLMYVCVYGNVHSVGNSSLKYRNAVTINMIWKCVERSLWECLGVATWRGTQILMHTYIHIPVCIYIFLLTLCLHRPNQLNNRVVCCLLRRS